MTRILFITVDENKKYTIEAQNGVSLMEAAVLNHIPGVEAECGGACSCATCQVYIDDAWIDKVGLPDSMEEDMLDFAYEPEPTSRLSCQITVTQDLDGLVAFIPLKQN